MNTINKYYIPEVKPDDTEIIAIKEYEKEKNEGNFNFVEGNEVFRFLNNLK